MSEKTAVKRVNLAKHHRSPGRTRHVNFDGRVETEFPSFTHLEIVRFSGDSGYYLLHICADGQQADTWHGTLEEAYHQAEYEFDVKRDEWQDA